MLRYSLLLLLLLPAFGIHLSAQFLIEGQVKADSSWAPHVYLSLVPTFEDMYTVSPDMIALQAPIDAEGRFRFTGEYLPKGDHLYRLHMSKKGDPPSTIVIGGKDENHFFLIANPEIQCPLEIRADSSLWGNLNMEDCYVNYGLQKINRILLEYEANASRDFSLGREFLKIARDEKLRSYADTSQHLLLSLYALHHTHAKAHALEAPQYYENFFQKWELTDNQYLDEFRTELGLVSAISPTNYTPWIAGFLCLLLGMGIQTFLSKLKTSTQDSSEQLFKELSLQERKIFLLIREGKSNKEISEQLHIEPTTVKSHVRNVYGKLKIRSRKEALNFSASQIGA